MGELPHLVKDLALILVVAGIVTIVFKKLKQPLVLGYVVAGFLVSPHMPYIMSVADRADISTWGDIGVMFLLFSLGLDFSFKKILKMGASPIISTCSIVFCMMMLVDVSHCAVPFTAFAEKLETMGNEMNLSIHVMHEDIFNSMHKI